MNSTVETEVNTREPAQSTPYRKYEVDLKSCNVELYQSVSPATIIGRHFTSGHAVRAGIFGQIATIYFNPMHDSLLILSVSQGGNSQ
jgi:hypothetical protein